VHLSPCKWVLTTYHDRTKRRVLKFFQCGACGQHDRVALSICGALVHVLRCRKTVATRQPESHCVATPDRSHHPCDLDAKLSFVVSMGAPSFITQYHSTHWRLILLGYPPPPPCHICCWHQLPATQPVKGTRALSADPWLSSDHDVDKRSAVGESGECHTLSSVHGRGGGGLALASHLPDANTPFSTRFAASFEDTFMHCHVLTLPTQPHYSR
jgi:hypothetical protein